MKNIIYLFYLLFFIIFLSCKNEKVDSSLDIFIADAFEDEKIPQDLIQLLMPFKNDDTIFLCKGKLFNEYGSIDYAYKSKFENIKKSITSNTPFLTLKQKVREHLNNINAGIFKNKPSNESLNKTFQNYDEVLYYNNNRLKENTDYSSKIFSKSSDIISYIFDTLYTKSNNIKILVVYNYKNDKNNIEVAQDKGDEIGEKNVIQTNNNINQNEKVVLPPTPTNTCNNQVSASSIEDFLFKLTTRTIDDCRKDNLASNYSQFFASNAVVMIVDNTGAPLKSYSSVSAYVGHIRGFNRNIKIDAENSIVSGGRYSKLAVREP